MSGASIIEIETSLVWLRGRPTVYCSIQHFIASGMTIGELFTHIRGELVTALQAAVGCDPEAKEFSTTTRVDVERDEADPSVRVAILNPKRCLADLDEHIGRMQKIASRFIEGSARPAMIGGSHA
jgi:hypothetical protein